jgi:hypothetical protein
MVISYCIAETAELSVKIPLVHQDEIMKSACQYRLHQALEEKVDWSERKNQDVIFYFLINEKLKNQEIHINSSLWLIKSNLSQIFEGDWVGKNLREKKRILNELSAGIGGYTVFNVVSDVNAYISEIRNNELEDNIKENLRIFLKEGNAWREIIPIISFGIICEMYKKGWLKLKGQWKFTHLHHNDELPLDDFLGEINKSLDQKRPIIVSLTQRDAQNIKVGWHMNIVVGTNGNGNYVCIDPISDSLSEVNYKKYTENELKQMVGGNDLLMIEIIDDTNS